MAVRAQEPSPFERFVVRPVDSKMEPFNAWSLAHASEVAYKEEADVKAEASAWGFTQVRTFGYQTPAVGKRNLTQVYVASKDDIVLVCYRGTEGKSVLDWLRNVNAVLTPGGPFGSTLHKGFSNALNEPSGDATVLRQVIDLVKDLSTDGRAVYLAGHSLGGALATLTAGYLLEENVALTGVYTYGAPRVADGKFAAEYDKRARALTHRFVNRQDPVPRLPPATVGYRHQGGWWFISKTGVVNQPGWWLRIWDAIAFDANDENNWVTHHSLSTAYLPGLLRNLHEE